MSTYQERKSEFCMQMNTLLDSIRSKAVVQFDYNERTNLPERIIKP
jgi:hypothetical protein